MNPDNLFITGLTVVVVTLITSLAIHNHYEVKAIEAGIKGGADPLAVSCAYDPLSYCDIIASQSITSK